MPLGERILKFIIFFSTCVLARQLVRDVVSMLPGFIPCPTREGVREEERRSLGIR